MISVSLVEGPSLHRLTQYWGHEFCSGDKRGSMLRPRELLKHTSVREPVVWSGVPVPGGESDCTLWVMELH